MPPEVHQVANTAVRMFSHGRTDLLVATADDVRWIPAGATGGRTVITGIKVDSRPQTVLLEGSKRVRVALPWRTRLVEIDFVQPRSEIAGANGFSSYLIRTGSFSEREATFSDIPEPWTMFRWADDGQIRGGLFVPISRDDSATFLNRPRLRDTAPVVLRHSRDDGPASAFVAKRVATADTTGWLRLPDEAQRRIVIEHPARTLAAGLHRVVVYGRNGPSSQGDSAAVEFVVAEAPWVRWWFVGPLLVALAATGAVYRRHRHRREADIARLRTRIAADLHDSVGASLSRIAILSDVVARQVGEQIPKAGPSLKAIGDNARSVIDEMNDAVWFIDPDIRNIGDMLVRIRTVAAQLFEPDQVAWSVDAEERIVNLPLTSEQRRHMYLLVKEALTNVRRHAEPSFVAVRFVMAAGGLRVEIDDDGDVTMPTSGERRGNGIANMRARAAELDGTLAVEPRLPGPGTRVVVQTNLR
jgi:signal transduction histidine kinase